MAHAQALLRRSATQARFCIRRWWRRLPALATSLVILLDSSGVAVAQNRGALDVRAQREEVVMRLHGVPEDELRQQYLRCAHVSNERLLAPVEATLCTLVAEVLLARAFGGSFDALIVWYQRQRDPAPAFDRR